MAISGDLGEASVFIQSRVDNHQKMVKLVIWRSIRNYNLSEQIITIVERQPATRSIVDDSRKNVL